jgi:hypothetical protein
MYIAAAVATAVIHIFCLQFAVLFYRIVEGNVEMGVVAFGMKLVMCST